MNLITKLKTVKLSTWITISAVAITAAGSGIGFGIWFHNSFYGGETVDYGAIDVNSFNVDYNQYYQSYQKEMNSGAKVVWEDKYSPAQMANLALALYAHQDRVLCQGYGTGRASVVDQEIRSTAIKVGNKFFKESNSLSSIVNIAWRFYEEGDELTTYFGKCKGSNVEVGVFDADEPTVQTKDEYSAQWGRPISTPIAHVINDRTVLTNDQLHSKAYGKTEVVKTDSGYVIDLEMDPTTTVIKYIYEMKSLSDLPKFPSFEYCHLVFETDLDLKLSKSLAIEKYFANTGSIGAYVTCTMTSRYQYDGDIEIPKLSTPCEYVYVY